MDHHETEADGHAGGSLNGRLVGGEEHDHDEDGGEDHLDEECPALADAQVGGGAIAVRTEADPALRIEGRRVHHGVEQVGAGDGAGQLGHDVGHPLDELHAAGGDEAERHCRVDVRTGDRADGVGERRQHQPEGESGGRHAGRVAEPEELEAERLGGDADRNDDQHQRAEELRGELSDVQLHDGDLLCPWRGKSDTESLAVLPGAGADARCGGPGQGAVGRWSAPRPVCREGSPKWRPSPARPRRAGGWPWRPASCARGRARRRARR